MEYSNKMKMNIHDDTKSLGTGGTNSPYSYDEVFPALPGGIPKVKSEPMDIEPTTLNNNQNQKMGIHSSVITQVFVVPADERKYDHSEKFGEGESVRTCAQISRETGVQIEISTSKDKALSFLITGRLNNVMEAKRKLLSNFQTQASYNISIPKEHHRLILGKNGARLKEVEKNTGAKISIPHAQDTSDKITVVGTRESIEKAVHEIKVISDEQSKKAFERIKVPKIYHPFIAGVNNEKISQLMTETNTRINVPPWSTENAEITITGEKDGVENAKNEIMKTYREMDKTFQTISVEVPKWQHKYVIGHKRSTVSEILQKTGVSVEVPQANVPADSITLRGPYKFLGDALKLLYSKATSMQCDEIEAPAHIHRLIIGKRGANIRELQDTYKQFHVEFANDKIRIEGSPDVIEEVKKKLEAQVHYYLHEYDIVELEVDPKYFKYIIGKNGVNVNRLKNDNDVSISITENTHNSIKIEGPKENVAQVKKELEEQIQKLENEKECDIIIDRKFHRMISGNKREKIKELQDTFKVIIIIPSLNENSNIVKIKGQKEGVDKCYKHLTKIVKELSENNYTIKVPIMKQFHKCIIGRGGNNIRKIRDETGTTIELPAEGEKSDTITITGRKEKVEEAKERILKIPNEMMSGRGLQDDVSKGKQMSDFSAEKQFTNNTIEIKANPEYHKFLIGKNGMRIKKIRETTGARIIFPNEGDSNKETILIIGDNEATTKAKEELESMIKQINNTVEQIVHVNPKYHKNFTNNRGELIHKISDDCGGVIISFPRFTMPNDSKVIVKGNPDGVRDAVKTIENIVKDLDSKLEDEIHVAPRHHKHFVSRKGEVLQGIIQECGGNDHVTISFPRTDIKESKVILKGFKESINLAKKRISEIVKDLEEQITIEVVIPHKDHRSLMRSRTYPTIEDIRKEHNVKITFPERINPDYQQDGQTEINGHIGDDDKVQIKDIITITGKPKNCEAAKLALLDIVPVTIELDIPYSYHGSIIGQSGNVIREIINNFEVQVDVPKPELNLDLIKIRGRPASVEEAKNAIIKKKKEIDERELKSYEVKLKVDPEYHPQIIGRKGDVINKIRNDHNVTISLPKKDDPDNIITITGFQKDVEAARADILNIVNRLEIRFREKVSIDRRVHSRMIGAKGRFVKRIMEEYEVEIRFPRDTDPDPNVVVICGDEEKVMDCKDYLLSLEDDFVKDLHDEPEIMVDPRMGMPVAANGKNEAGFVVKNAPWDQKAPDTSSISEFPSFGNVDTNKPFAELGKESKPVWGPRR